VFVACLPGAAVLLAAWIRRSRSAPWLERRLPARLAVLPRRDGALDA
jgi:hypothetical protein